jgi:hypothetical protein
LKTKADCRKKPCPPDTIHYDFHSDDTSRPFPIQLQKTIHCPRNIICLPGIQNLNGHAKMLRTEVRILQNHLQIGMTKYLFHSRQRDPCHYHPACRGMAQVVEHDTPVGQFRLDDGPVERFFQVTPPSTGFKVEEHMVVGDTPYQTSERGIQTVIYRDATGVAGLCFLQVDYPMGQIDL